MLASPEAAASQGVRREVEFWLQNRSLDKMLIVLTDGELIWDSTVADFDWSQTPALPEILKKRFTHEPLWLDLRWAKTADDLSLKDPRFRDEVAALAATLQDRPKDEIMGQDVRQHRRTLLLAVGVLLAFIISVGIAAYIAIHQSNVTQEMEHTEELVEMIRQVDNTAQQIRLILRSLNRQTDGLVHSLVTSGAIENVADPKHAETLRTVIDGFIYVTQNVLYVGIMNAEQRGFKGVAPGAAPVSEDEFVRKRLRDAFQSAELGHAYHSGSFLVTYGSRTEPVIVMALPMVVGKDFRGMVATVVSLEFLRKFQRESSRGSSVIYVVDRNGRLVIHPDERRYTIGQDMSHITIVQTFLKGSEQATIAQVFVLQENGKQTEMVGAETAVPELGWGVIAQRPAYFQ